MSKTATNKEIIYKFASFIVYFFKFNSINKYVRLLSLNEERFDTSLYIYKFIIMHKFKFSSYLHYVRCKFYVFTTTYIVLLGIKMKVKKLIS